MALDVEDGTGRATAESYVSVAVCDAYHTARGNAGWAGSNAVKEQALRKATDYMVQAYRLRWKGYRSYAIQALDWPRQNVPIADTPQTGDIGPSSYVDANAIPQEVKDACCELALRSVVSGDLAPDVARVAKRSRVGDIEVEYDEGSQPYTTYRAIDNRLRIFLSASGAMVKVVRT